MRTLTIIQKKQRRIGNEICLRSSFRKRNNKIYNHIFGELDVRILLKLFVTKFDTKAN